MALLDSGNLLDIFKGIFETNTPPDTDHCMNEQLEALSPVIFSFQRVSENSKIPGSNAAKQHAYLVWFLLRLKQLQEEAHKIAATEGLVLEEALCKEALLLEALEHLVSKRKEMRALSLEAEEAIREQYQEETRKEEQKQYSEREMPPPLHLFFFKT